MSLIFRPGSGADVPSVARLAAHSFPAIDRSLPEWEEHLTDSPHGGVEALFVGEEEGRVVAACRLYRFEQWVRGNTIPIMGLGTVTISATSRRQGLAGRMTAASLDHARERGDLATALYPFRTSFYRKLGYGLAGEVHQFRFPPAALPDDPGRSRVSLVESDRDRAAVQTVFDRWAPLQTGQLVRSLRSWDLVWQGGTRHGVIYRGPTGEGEGYAVFRYHAVPPRGERAVDVEEIAWLTPEARRGLYAWLASLADQWDAILYRAHPEEAFPEHLSEHRFPADEVPRWHFWFAGGTVLHGPMFRLLDIERAWGARQVRSAPPLTLALDVHDAQLPTNAGQWTLSFADGRVHVERGEARRADLRIGISIESLSRLYIGALSPSGAALAGVATIDRPQLLERLDWLLGGLRPWTFDRF